MQLESLHQKKLCNKSFQQLDLQISLILSLSSFHSCSKTSFEQRALHCAALPFRNRVSRNQLTKQQLTGQTAYSPTTQLRFCFRGSFREKSFNIIFAAYSLDLDKLELSFSSLAQINKPESLQKKIGKEQVHSFFVNNSFSLPNLSSKNNKELEHNIFQKNSFNKSFFNISFHNNK